MSPEEFSTRAQSEFGHGYITAIAARLRVSDRHVTAWAEGKVEIPPQHVEALNRLFQSREEARQLVERFLAALTARAAEAGIERADIAAALAGDIDVRLACAGLRDAGRQPLSRRQ